MNERINIQDLAAILSERASISKKEAETFLREYFEVLNDELIKDGSLKIKNLGTFKLLLVEDRESIDVSTGERVLIPEHYKVAFTSDKKLAEMINEPFSAFETIEVEGETVETGETEEIGDTSTLLSNREIEEAEETEETETFVAGETETLVAEEIIPFYANKDFYDFPTPQPLETGEAEETEETGEALVIVEEQTLVEEEFDFPTPQLLEKGEAGEIGDTSTLLSNRETKEAGEVGETETLVEEKTLFSNENLVTFDINTYCQICYDRKENDRLREKCNKLKKKSKRQEIIIWILSIFIIATVGYIASLKFF
jgi:nucleoid DNA-binding protein